MLAPVALVVVSHFSRLGDLPLLGEEGRRERSAINMIESNDWVVVTNQGFAFPDVRGTVKSTAWDLSTVQDRIAAGRHLKSLFASGGSVALKKVMFLELGGFLSVYKPFYSEDMDLCTRAWMRGWQTLLEPRSKVVHDHVGTIKRHFHAKKIRIIRLRNRHYYMWLYCSRRQLFLSHAPWTILRLFLRLLRLDVTLPVALIISLAHVKPILALRSQIQQQQPFKPLEQILKEIESE